MTFFDMDGMRLPEITLIGEDAMTFKHRNIRRVSEDYIYYIVLDGELFVNEDGTEYHLKQGDCFLFEPDKLHYGTVDTLYNLLYIHFRHGDIKKTETEDITDTTLKKDNRIFLPKLVNLPVTTGLINTVSLVRSAIRYGYVTVNGYGILCACAVQEAFVEIARLSAETDENKSFSGLQLANEVITFLNANYNRKLTGAIIEGELSYNFDYINQLFHRYFNCTVFQTLNKIRMEKAKTLIISSEISMSRIAAEVGYNDEAYFSKVFKKSTGLSPSQYRQGFKK